jgi:nitroreductase
MTGTFLDLVTSRRSVRSYSQQIVEPEKLRYVLECGRLAPSAANRQPWLFYLVQDKEVRGRIDEAYVRPWFAEAPLVVAVCIDRTRTWVRKDGKDYGDVDAAIAMDHMTLAAAEQGLGTCWIGAFDKLKVKKALSLPKQIEPVALTPLGYPTDTPREKDRRSMEEVVHWK